MNNDIVEKAKNIIYNSNIMTYVPKEKIDRAFFKIHIFNNKEEFIQAYGKNDYEDSRLEGFNRNHESFIGPDATTHTVIHEVLHELSSKFDKQGHRLENGIMGYDNYRFANQINEGCTDYIAAKLSGEEPRNYIKGHKLFTRIEPMLIKYADDPNIILKMYIDRDTSTLSVFLNSYVGKGTFENLYENFLFMKDDQINNILDKAEKNLNKDFRKRERKEKLNNFIYKIRNIFSRKEKGQKLLTDGSEHYINEHQQFIQKYDIDNFQSNTIKEDIQKYSEYQQETEQKHEQNNSENERE